jgi:heat shock protein HslJ
MASEFSALLLFTSCNTATSPEELCQRQGAWQLVEISNGMTITIPDPEKYTIRFEAGGQVSVKADCNTCFGSYQAEGNALSLEPLACTEVFCGEFSLFDPYTTALSTVSSFVRQGDRLELSHAGGILKFRVPIEAPG